MNLDINSILSFYNNFDVFLVVFVRFLGFFMLVPVFGGMNIPVMTKVTISAGVALIAASSGNIIAVNYNDTMAGYIGLIATELITGLIIGFVVYFMFSVYLFVGQLVDYQLGFAMASVFDPLSSMQVPITGNLYYLFIAAMFVRLGGLDQFIQILFYSYKTIPIGTARILNGNIAGILINQMVIYIQTGVKIALPVIGTIIIVDLALGLLVKAVPQMNIFVVGMPVKVFIGLIVVYLIVPVIADSYFTVFTMAKGFVRQIIMNNS